MPLILKRDEVLDIYSEAASKKWVLPNFNAENLTSIEAILGAVKDYGESIGVEDLPVIIGITNNYSHRPQSVFYTHTRKWNIGLKLFLSDLSILTSSNSPYNKLKVMVHLDHIQWDEDKELLNWDLEQFSSIMFDASTLPLEENIEMTKDFVEKNKSKIVIEGACDEISSANSVKNKLTTPDMAEKYYNQTGIDIVVPNLGTEHRASEADLKYENNLAKMISKEIGKYLCLHGTSSVSTKKLSNLFNDGICKVNIWTALERDSSPVLFEDMISNSSKIVGYKKAKSFLEKELLGNKSIDKCQPSIDYFTTTYRQEIIFREMKNIVMKYLRLWYV